MLKQRAKNTIQRGIIESPDSVRNQNKVRKIFQTLERKKSFWQAILKRLGFYKEVHYINGSQILPAPLSSDDEAEVFKRLIEKDQKAKDQLVVHNLRLVVYIAKKFESSGVGLEDLISIGTIGLIKAVNTFCPLRNIKLATYASRCIENEILMHLRKTNHSKGEMSIDEPLNVDWDGNELLLSDILGTESDHVSKGIEKETEKNILLSCVEKLNSREALIMKMRFGLLDGIEHTQKDVADIVGISQSYISRLEKRIMKQLKKSIEELD